VLTIRKREFERYHLDFSLGRVHVVRGSLGTRDKGAAHRYLQRIEIALADRSSAGISTVIFRAAGIAVLNIRYSIPAFNMVKPADAGVWLRSNRSGRRVIVR
jgi:hypothetical protein